MSLPVAVFKPFWGLRRSLKLTRFSRFSPGDNSAGRAELKAGGRLIAVYVSSSSLAV